MAVVRKTEDDNLQLIYNDSAADKTKNAAADSHSLEGHPHGKDFVKVVRSLGVQEVGCL
jgi:hypothetical protein